METIDETAAQDSTVRPDVISSIPTDFIPSSTPSSTIHPDPNPISSGLAAHDSSDVDDNDEIIREIDVYISPELAKTMHLVQFPLQKASHTTPPTVPTDQSNSHKRNRSNHPQRPTLTQTDPPPLPTAARIKPQHSLLELDYSVPTYSFSSQRSVPEVLDLASRTFTSTEIPITTHMALGLFDNTGSKINLVPLHTIYQMRPTFRHIDAVFDDDDLISKQSRASHKDTTKNEEGNNPILFQKVESERSVQIRESSYAHKRAMEDKEEWIPLEVHGFRSGQRRDAMKSLVGKEEDRTKDLGFVNAGRMGGSVGYVKSLNYLPNVNFEEDMDEDFVRPVEEDGRGTVNVAAASAASINQNHNGEDAIVVDGENEQDEEIDDAETSFMKELTERIAKLLQGRGGIPIPFPVIRSRYHPSVTDEDLLQATSASAALVRGNFLLKSSLLGLTSPHVANARDLILILLNKHGFVQHEKLIAVYESLDAAEDIARFIVTSEILGALLNMVGRKTMNGVELKVDDDPTIEADFGEVVRKHEEYWKRKEELLSEYVALYEEQM